MALVLKDRVRETTNVTGTGTMTLQGAVEGFETFTSAIGVGNQTYYSVATTTQWEVGVGTVGAGNTLTRDKVLDSSNSGNLVDFTAGDKDIFVTYPAKKSATRDNLLTYSIVFGS